MIVGRPGVASHASTSDCPCSDPQPDATSYATVASQQPTPAKSLFAVETSRTAYGNLYWSGRYCRFTNP